MSSVLANLGNNLRERRKSLNLTQEQLADRANLDRSYIGGVERGERNVTITVLFQISSALECDVSELTKGLNRRTE